MRSKRWSVCGVIASTLVLTAVTAGCAGREPIGPGAGGGRDDLTAQLPAARGDIAQLTWNLPHGEPDILDPKMSVDFSSTSVVSNLCDPLLRVAPDFTTSPNLATYRQPDRTTLVLTLRSGVRFWNGREMTAADVAYSLNRNRSEDASLAFLFARVRSITVTGAREVTVRFSQPDELFVKELGTPAGMVVDKQFAQRAGASFGTSDGGLMCSGPLRLTSWRPGSQLELVRNDDYWNPAYRARAAKVRIQFVTDSPALAQGLVSGEIDGAFDIPPTVIPRLADSTAGRLAFGESTQSLEFAIAHPGGVLGDVRLRQALMKAIDREGIAKAIFQGAAEPNYTFLTRSSWDPTGEQVYAQNYTKWRAANAYNPDRARQLVQSSTYRGQTLRLATLAGDDTQALVAQLMQQEFKGIGVDMVIDEVQPLTYTSMTYDPAARRGEDLILVGSYNQVPDPIELLGFIIEPGQAYNYTDFDDKTASARLAQAQGTYDPIARARLVVEVQDAYESTFAGTSLVQNLAVTYLNDRLTGVTTSFAYMFRPALALIGAKTAD